jgi:hypothetical protein
MKIDKEKILGALFVLQAKAQDDSLAARAAGYMREVHICDGKSDGLQSAIDIINLMACTSAKGVAE